MFTATDEELDLIADILVFTRAETSRILSTEAAIEVFERSDLSRNDLREIWRLADKDRNGMLTAKELAIALRLIGWVQAGEPLTEHLIELPGPSPTLKGISDVQKTLGPTVAPPQFAPPRHSPRSTTLPVGRSGGHVANRSMESLAASTSRLPRPRTPSPLRTANSEPSPLPTIEDDLPTPIVGLPPTALHNLTFLTSPRSTRTMKRHTADHSKGSSAATSPKPKAPSNPFSPPSTAPLQPPEVPEVPESMPEEAVSVEVLHEEPEETLTSTLAASPTSAGSQENLQLPLPPSAPPSVPPSPLQSPEAAPAAPSSNEDEISRLKGLLEASESKAKELEGRMRDSQSMLTQVLGANEGQIKRLETALEDATVRITTLERAERQLKDMSALAQSISEDLERTKKEKAEQILELRETILQKERKILELEGSASRAEEAKLDADKATAAITQRLTADNLRLTQRLEERDRSFVEEKGRLSARIQELEVIAAELQWSEAEVGLQRALQEATQNNDTLKRNVQELQGRVTLQQQDRQKHEVEMSGLQRQLVELRRENARLALQTAQTGNRRRRSQPDPSARGAARESEAPPPAYDDAVFV